MRVLREICGEDELHFQLTRELLDIERQCRTMARRSGLFKALERGLRKGFYDSAEDAEQRALERRGTLEVARAGAAEVQLPLIQIVGDPETGGPTGGTE